MSAIDHAQSTGRGRALPPWPTAVIVLAGLAVLAVAIIDPFAIFTARAAWFAAMAGVAVLLLGAFAAIGHRLFGLMVGTLVVGGAAQLYVTAPAYYSTLNLPPSGEEIAVYLFVLVQALVSYAVLRRTWRPGLAGRIATALGWPAIVLLFSVTVVFAYPIVIFMILDQMSTYAVNIAIGALLVIINLATLAAIVATAPKGLVIPSRSGWLLALVALFLALTLATTIFAFQRVVHVADELAYLFQARTYAGGALWVPALPEALQDAFAHYLLDTENGRWISVFTPGWPAVLALGVLAGAYWLVNPILGVVCILLGYRLLTRVTDDRTAAIALLLMAISPWFVAMSASLMPHTLTLVLVLFAWCTLLSVDQRGPASAAVLSLAAGLAMGWLFFSRNLDGLVIGTVTGAYLLFHSTKTRRPGVVAGYALGCIVSGSLIFAYNAYFTGDPLQTPLSVYLERIWIGGSNAFGFGKNIGPPVGWGRLELWPNEHSLLEGFWSSFNSMNVLHTDFMGWSIGSLAFFWAFVIWGQKSRWDWFMLAVIAATIISHLFYWFSASYYVGARYWFMTFFPLVFLSARGVTTIEARLEAAGIYQVRPAVNALVLTLCAFSVVVFLSYRDATRYYQHRFQDDHYRSLEIPGGQNRPAPLVIVSEYSETASFLFLNDPWFPGDKPVFATDLGLPRNRDVIAAFPDRPVIYYNESTGEFSN